MSRWIRLNLPLPSSGFSSPIKTAYKFFRFVFEYRPFVKKFRKFRSTGQVKSSLFWITWNAPVWITKMKTNTLNRHLALRKHIFQILRRKNDEESWRIDFCQLSKNRFEYGFLHLIRWFFSFDWYRSRDPTFARVLLLFCKSIHEDFVQFKLMNKF